MEQQHYHSSITANVTPIQASENISHVAAWWTSSLQGISEKQGDIFTVHFGKTFVTFEVTEAITGKKITWQVTDSYLAWLDNNEWTGTKVVFDISTEKGATRIDFTHVGLLPDVACYENCKQGWGFFINQSLSKLMNEGKGTPDVPVKDRQMAVA